MKHLRKLLFPFSALYFGGVWLRNKFFDSGVWKSQSYDFLVICIGNLSTGGTGKTPMTEFLIRLIKEKTSIGILSRGYGRKTKGYKRVTASHKAIEVGDEPLQYATKFSNVQVAVCEDRRTGIKRLRAQKPAPEVILLDDAFQHRKVSAGFSILLTSYHQLFYTDYVLPVGNLRDLRVQAKRAQAIVVTKCPKSISLKEREEIRFKVSKYSKSTVYFATISYDNEVCGEGENVALEGFKNKDVTLVTGIANPEPLLDFLEGKNITYKHKRFRDHHNFTSSELTSLEKCPCILTTEKDYMRLKTAISHNNIYYLPIKMHFLETDGHNFGKRILDIVCA